jgi:hypothetical protein
MITGSSGISTRILSASTALPPSTTCAAVHPSAATNETAVLLAILGCGGAAWAAGASTSTPRSCDPAAAGPSRSLVDPHRLRNFCHGAEALRAVQLFGPRAATHFSVTRRPAVSFCEGGASRPSTTSTEAPKEDGNKPGRTDAAARIPTTTTTTTTLSWWHRALYQLSIRQGLPLPRRVGRNDPDLVVTRHQRNERQRDEQRARALQQRLVQLVQQKQQQQQRQSTLAQDALDVQLAQLVQELYGVLYGEGVTPQSRQEFLERHGCTGWTDQAMDAILRKAMRYDGQDDAKSQHMPRGVVEIGAGHGQWARQIADRYRRGSATGPAPSKPFDIVLAYDDQSSLPLNSAVYHRHTKPHRDHFYDRVQPCPSIPSVLSQWQCRGRILLLVYPPPDSNMARDALEAYVGVDDRNNDTVMYVGEGRGGANANDAFFDLLESGQWVLEEIVNVRPMGSKGYERMYVFARSQSVERHD